MAGRITALEPQQRARDRVNVYLDGEFAFGLAGFVAVNLKVGSQLSDEAISELKAADGVERAHNSALNYLSYRPRSEAEMREYLAGKTDSSGEAVAEDVIEEVVRRLRRAGLVDDAEFARYWCENRARFRPRGRRGLQSELRQKGVASGVIDEALDDYDELAAVTKVARDQARRLSHLPPDTFRRRLYARLARRGFSSYLIQEALETLETPDAPDFPQLNDEPNEED